MDRGRTIREMVEEGDPMVLGGIRTARRTTDKARVEVTIMGDTVIEGAETEEGVVGLTTWTGMVQVEVAHEVVMTMGGEVEVAVWITIQEEPAKIIHHPGEVVVVIT